MKRKDKIITREIRDNVKKLAVADSIPNCKFCLVLSIILEAYFIITRYTFDNSFTNLNKPLLNIYIYILLPIVAIVSYWLLCYFNKDSEKGYKKIRILQSSIAVFYMVWSTAITILNVNSHAEMSYVIYCTVIVILPSVIYIDATVLNIAYVICDLFLIIFTIIMKPHNYIESLVGFSIFAIVSLIACNIYSKTKFDAIKRSIDLQLSADRDHLTKIYNRQKLNETSSSIINTSYEEKYELSCIMMDIDDFKKINDTYGHLVGDKVLKGIAKTVLNEVKKYNGKVFRYGGEEFLALFPNLSKNQAVNFVKKLQNQISKGIPDFDEPVTLSFGIYTKIPSQNDNIEKYYEIADNLLYKSKNNGKNRYTAMEHTSIE